MSKKLHCLPKKKKMQQQQLNASAQQKKFLIIGILGILLLGIFIFRNILLKRKNEKHLREIAENEVELQKLENEKQLTELEMQALRAQMNPHFIFNCLSSINRFILKNETESASDYLTKFSRLIRMVLNNSKQELIALEDELEMLRLYLDLEKLRFRNSFDYKINCINEIDADNIFIPPLILQPFAENAIWHGLMHKQGHGHLEIKLSVDKKILTCVISDNGIGRSKAAMLQSTSTEHKKSMGQQITKERLTLFNQGANEGNFLNFEDIKDDEGNEAGTRVILRLRYKNMTEAST
jgi:LytS/YehU family sensor histidine kinase